jgi:CheY-like chemotaxis protein
LRAIPGFSFLHDTVSKRILIIEDNEVERLGMSVLLRREGYEVSTASNSTEGLTRSQAECPDLILLDMMMPASDGWHFLEARKKDAGLAHSRVVIVTGLPVASDAWAGELGAAGLIRKPLDTTMLTEMVKQLIG